MRALDHRTGPDSNGREGVGGLTTQYKAGQGIQHSTARYGTREAKHGTAHHSTPQQTAILQCSRRKGLAPLPPASLLAVGTVVWGAALTISKWLEGDLGDGELLQRNGQSLLVTQGAGGGGRGLHHPF